MRRARAVHPSSLLRQVASGVMADEARSLNFGQLVLDAWAGLSHKAPVGDASPRRDMMPSWVPDDDRRRLAAYLVLRAYVSNVARHYVDTGTGSVALAKNRREYGDAALLIEAVADAALGEEFEIVVDHAGDDDPAAPTAADVVEGGPTLEELTAEYEAQRAAIDRARERQQWFDVWVDDEQVIRKLLEAEQTLATCGDVVFLVTWSNKAQRVKLRWYDPGFYFPVFDEYDEDGFPSKVHLAWEYDDADKRTHIRRITFELVDLPIGEQSRRYPYAPDVESKKRCVMSDLDWLMEKTDGTITRLNVGEATANVNADGEELWEYDLGIDFIPLVHLPCFPAGDEHFGESALTRIAQILDDLQASDTDRQTTSSLVGSPPISISGVASGSGEVRTYGPGQLYRLGEGGRMDVLDTSNALKGLSDYIEALRDRMHENRGLPTMIAGRASVEDVNSGILALLSFGPYTRLVKRLRMARGDQYRLLFKFVQRLAIVGGVLESADDEESAVHDVRVAFGPYLPNDLPSLLQLYASLVGDHLLSRSTALQLMRDAGLAIDDLDAELDRIRAEDFEGAKALADATNNDADASDYLGRTAPTEAEGGALP